MNTRKILIADVAYSAKGSVALLEKARQDYKAVNDPPYKFFRELAGGRVRLYAEIKIKPTRKNSDDGSRGAFF